MKTNIYKYWFQPTQVGQRVSNATTIILSLLRLKKKKIKNLNSSERPKLTGRSIISVVLRRT